MLSIKDLIRMKRFDVISAIEKELSESGNSKRLSVNTENSKTGPKFDFLNYFSKESLW